MAISKGLASDLDVIGPTTNWCELNGPVHAVQFYSNESYLLKVLGRFIGTALGAGDAAIVVATQTHHAGLVQQLQARGLNVELAAGKGRYIALDSGESLSRFMTGKLPDARHFAEFMGPTIARANAASLAEQPRVAVFGEMVAQLWLDGNEEGAVRLEQLWDELIRAHSLSLLCAYPMSSFHREEHGNAFLRICAKHSRVIPAEGYTELATEEERLRRIGDLQQKAQALSTEIAQRKEIQKSLQQREADLADFLENAVEGVQQVGPDQRIRWANKSLLTLLGYSSQEYVGHRVSEFHVSPSVFDEFWQRLMRRETVYDYPADLRCKDGSVRHVLIHSNGLWDSGRFVRTRCFIRDVTEHKRMEEILRRSEKLAATGRLAAIIAHEINNPLESLTNLLYLLQSQASLDGEARYYATLADRELRRISHITRQMLAFYRETARPVRFSISEVLDGVLEMFEPRLSSKNISVQKSYATGGTLVGFPSEIRQLFANLVGNAIEAAGIRGTIRIDVAESCDWCHLARRGTRISIADNGAGIGVDSRRKIFDPFFTTKGESGTGLGLWVCRGIVQKHEGSIRFRSSVEPGRSGTVFSVFLPTLVTQRSSSTARALEAA